MDIVYGVVLFGFALMALRSLQVAGANWRRGYSVLERPRLRGRDALMTAALLELRFLALMVTRHPGRDRHGGRVARLHHALRAACRRFVVIHRMVGGIDCFPLLAVPFFILAGNLMNNAGITNRIYNFALALVGWLKGGLGHVNISAR